MFSLPPVEGLASVKAALGWLLGLDESMPASDVLREAHERGLIDAQTGAQWKAADPMLRQMAKAALRRKPLQSEKLGTVLHGLGELGARSHARLRVSVQAHLKVHRESLDLFAILNTAASLDDASRRPATLDAIASSQWVTNAKLAWVDLQNACYRLGHPWIDGSGVFGFAFVVKCVLRLDPSTIDRWVAAHPQAPSLATIATVLARTAMRAGALRPLLKSDVPALRLMAAAALVSPVFPPRRPIGVGDVLPALNTGGTDAGDAIWIAGSLIKEAIHGRYRLQGGRKETTARRDYLDRHPENAFGGARNAEGEKQSLERRLAELNAQYETLIPALEQSLVELAASWPQKGLSETQLLQLDNIFVDTAEMRFRLAEKVSHINNRNWLLKRNLAGLKSYLGLAHPRLAFAEPLYLTERFATETAPWVARSSVLLFDKDEIGIGRRTGRSLDALTSEAERLLTRPFFAARASSRSQSVAMRAACAYLYALMVVAATPEDRRGEVEKLNEMAIEHTGLLLCVPLSYQLDARLFDRLASSAVHQMLFFTGGSEARRRWALNDRLSDFPRALALWSSPDLVDQYPELAASLFEEVGALPLSHGALDRQISNLLTLLDAAVASCVAADRSDLLEQISGQWDSIYADWLPVSNRWANAAADFIAAIDHEGPERTGVLADPALAGTHCRALVEARKNAAGP